MLVFLHFHFFSLITLSEFFFCFFGSLFVWATCAKLRNKLLLKWLRFSPIMFWPRGFQGNSQLIIPPLCFMNNFSQTRLISHSIVNKIMNQPFLYTKKRISLVVILIRSIMLIWRYLVLLFIVTFIKKYHNILLYFLPHLSQHIYLF